MTKFLWKARKPPSMTTLKIERSQEMIIKQFMIESGQKMMF